MITTTLVAYPWLSPTAFACLVIAGPFVGAWLASRPRLAWALTAVALVPVLGLTLVPVDRQLTERCVAQWSLPTPGRVELMANVVLFIAPVLLGGVATRRPLAVLAVAIGVSAGVELVQALVPAIGRSCDTNDWLSNAIGALVGAGLATLALRRAGPSTPGGRDVG